MGSADKKNRFILLKCISLGAFSFPTPFLIFLYLFKIVPTDELMRVMIVLFLIISGGVVGLVYYFRSSEMETKKDWMPSSNEETRFFNQKNRMDRK